jgi:hypothetical protein
MAPNASKEPASDRVVAAFMQLAKSSQTLNDEVAEWTKHVSIVNESLRKLGVGVSAWHVVSQGGDDENSHWRREIGFTKLEDEWCIALKKTSWDDRWPEEGSEEIWPFEDAPRWFMLDAGGKIPDLLETLVKRTDETTVKVTKRKEEAATMAIALALLTDGMSVDGTSAPEKEGK